MHVVACPIIYTIQLLLAGNQNLHQITFSCTLAECLLLLLLFCVVMLSLSQLLCPYGLGTRSYPSRSRPGRRYVTSHYDHTSRPWVSSPNRSWQRIRVWTGQSHCCIIYISCCVLVLSCLHGYTELQMLACSANIPVGIVELMQWDWL